MSVESLIRDIALFSADAYFKATLDTIAGMPKSLLQKGEEKRTQKILISYIKEFMSILLVAPVG